MSATGRNIDERIPKLTSAWRIFVEFIHKYDELVDTKLVFLGQPPEVADRGCNKDFLHFRTAMRNVYDPDFFRCRLAVDLWSIAIVDLTVRKQPAELPTECAESVLGFYQRVFVVAAPSPIFGITCGDRFVKNAKQLD